MDKVLKITSLKARESDYSYWMSKTPAERIEAIEVLRQQYMNFKKDVQPGLQRVCTIINKTSS
jgi:hypothetical protein